jgi:hypothetical protein
MLTLIDRKDICALTAYDTPPEYQDIYVCLLNNGHTRSRLQVPRVRCIPLDSWERMSS